MLRAGYTILIICASPILPWWVLVGLFLTGIILFRHFYEAIIFFIFYDLLYGLPNGFLLTQFSFSVCFIVIYLLVEGYKDQLRFYQN